MAAIKTKKQLKATIREMIVQESKRTPGDIRKLISLLDDSIQDTEDEMENYIADIYTRDSEFGGDPNLTKHTKEIEDAFEMMYKGIKMLRKVKVLNQ